MDNSQIQVLFDNVMADFSSDTELSPELIQSRRNRILQLQEAIESLPDSFGPDKINEGKLQHHFATGVYGRELFIPKGNLIVSKIHKGKTLNVIASGRIAVICPNHGYNVFEAPYCFVSNPLSKRVVIAIEDTLWITAHGTHKTDLNEIEDEIIAKDFAEGESK